METRPIVELKQISKRFPGVQALSDVNLTLYPGEVHILLGENGAGKSTLINVLGGIVSPDSGTIIIRGKEYQSLTPALSQSLGIAIIHQELAVVPQLTVAENIFLGRQPAKNRLAIDWKRMKDEARKVLGIFGVDLDPSTLVRDLSVAHQQVVEISKALAQKADIIVMDEPTSALTKREVEDLFSIIEKLKKSGYAIVYISHRLDEVKRLGDRVTVLKDGHYVGTRMVADVTVDDMVRMMVGRDVRLTRRTNRPRLGHEALRVENLTTPNKLKGISFSVRAGEVVGLAGIVGAGRSEVAKAIFGAEPGATGSLFIDGRPVTIRSPLEAIQQGIAFVPEDRRREGLIVQFPIRTNISLPWNQKMGKFLLNHKKERMLSEGAVRDLSIKTPSIDQIAGNLSGGNQQKVVIGKWLELDAKVIIFDEPTRGVDIGAKAEIAELISRFASQGKAVIVISSELPELLALCDRILVLYEGQLANEIPGELATEEDIVYSATTGLRRSPR